MISQCLTCRGYPIVLFYKLADKWTPFHNSGRPTKPNVNTNILLGEKFIEWLRSLDLLAWV